MSIEFIVASSSSKSRTDCLGLGVIANCRKFPPDDVFDLTLTSVTFHRGSGLLAIGISCFQPLTTTTTTATFIYTFFYYERYILN